MPQVLNKRTATAEQLIGAVYVGRPSIWGNPFVVGRDGSREECVHQFEAYVARHPRLQLLAWERLRGRNLVCWCAPRACHADIWLRIANGPRPRI